MPSRLSPLELHYRKADRIMLMVLWLMFLYSLGLALWHGTWGQALLVGGGTAAVMTVLQQLIAGRRLLRCAIGAAFMVMSALHINQAGGMLEMHFGIFVLLAFLVYYRDWLPIVVAAAVIAAHHLGFYALQTQRFSVTVVAQGSWPIIFLHAFYVVLESAILIYLALQTHAEAVEGAALMQTAEQLTENDDAIDRLQDLVCQAAKCRAEGLQQNGAAMGQLLLRCGIGQPGLVSYEPAYVDELAVLMRHGFDYMQQDDGGAVYLRLSTRSLPSITARCSRQPGRCGSETSAAPGATPWAARRRFSRTGRVRNRLVT